MNARVRLVLIASLIVVPVLVYAGAGAWLLWQRGWLGVIWWILPVCWGIAYALARSLRPRPMPVPDEVLTHWTARDQQAGQVVDRHAAAASSSSPDQLADPNFYWTEFRSLARDLARVYHPNASDPLGGLTVLELLAAADLALDEVSSTVERYVPAAHLLTVDKWRLLTKTPKYFRQANNAVLAVSALFNPIGAAARWMGSRLTMSPAVQLLQSNALGWFASTFVQRSGAALIEMYSGRLRGGASHWREIQQRSAEQQSPFEEAKAEPQPPAILVAGQSGAGKSSVAELLTGKRKSESSVAIREARGYGGAKHSEAIRELVESISNTDMLLLVVSATQAAREPDVQAMEALDGYFASRPERKRVPVVVVLTHIDSLSPSLEWSPPYAGWQDSEPGRPKERSIRGAVQYQSEVFGESASAVVPVCSDPSRPYGVSEFLLPAMTVLLGEARAAALVRQATSYRGDELGRVFTQLLQAGGAVVGALTSSSSRRNQKNQPRQ